MFKISYGIKLDVPGTVMIESVEILETHKIGNKAILNNGIW